MQYIYPIDTKTPPSYRVYYLYQQKKIYIGSYPSFEEAKNIYEAVDRLMQSDATSYTIPKLLEGEIPNLSFKKYISLLNFRDNHLLIHQPIYILKDYFVYFVQEKLPLLFDLKDLLFFSTHPIYKRGPYLFTKNTFEQYNILNRYGIKQYSKLGVDYYFKNENVYDLRRENIVLLNMYYGVSYTTKYQEPTYVCKIFTTKNIVLGHFTSEVEAAIAYNKACTLLKEQGFSKEYIQNTLPFLTKAEYMAIYDRITLSPRLLADAPQKRIVSSKQYRGVAKDKNGFKALIGYQGKQIYLGRYPTERRAAQAYNLASIYLYGKNGYINTVTPLTYDGDRNNIAKKLKKIGAIKTPILKSYEELQ